MKKLLSLIISLILLFIIYLNIVYVPRDYTYKYILDNYLITEKYSKDKGSYFFEIEYNKELYTYALENKYVSKRGLIKKVSTKTGCLSIKTIKVKDFIICKNDSEYVTSFFNKPYNEEEIDSFDNIAIYNDFEDKILVWNYENFLYFDGKKAKKIDLFDTDIYELKMITQLNRFLVIADYNQKYYFDKLYIIDSKNGRVKESKLNRKVYFDGYILGTYKDNIYLYDNDKEVEYVINPFKNTIDKNKLEILVNGKWEKTSLNKLKKQEVKFRNDEHYYYDIIDNKLYYITPINKILVSDMKVNRIVNSDNKICYFISDDSLYFVDIEKEMIKVMAYSEWAFNNQNIYVF